MVNRTTRSQMFYKIGVLKHFSKLIGNHLWWNHLLINLRTFSPVTLLKRDSSTNIILWFLPNFWEHLYKISLGYCFCIHKWTGRHRCLSYRGQGVSLTSFFKSISVIVFTSKVEQTRLSSIALIYIERSYPILQVSMIRITDTFWKRNNWKMQQKCQYFCIIPFPMSPDK